MFQAWWHREPQYPILFDLEPVIGSLTGIGIYTYQVSRHLLKSYPLTFQYPAPPTSLEVNEFTNRFGELYGQDTLTTKKISLIPQQKWRTYFQEKPRLFHMTNTVTRVEWKDTPLVVTAHDIAWLTLSRDIYPEPPHPGIQHLPRILSQAKHVIAVSECTRQDLNRVLGVPLNKISVIPHGPIDSFEPPPSPYVKAECRRKLAGDKPYFLHVGSIEPRKNLPRLIQGYASARSKGLKHLLLLVGQKLHDTDTVLNTIQKYKMDRYVHLRGYVSNDTLKEYYWGAEAFLISSLYEGFGIPALEAMQSGLPIISSQTGALPEILGDCCLTIDPFCPDSMAKAMLKIARNRVNVNTLIKKGLDRAQSFSWKKTAELTWNVYREVIHGHPLH